MVALLLSLLLLLSLTLIVIQKNRPDFFEKRLSDIIDDDKTLGSGRGDFYPFLFNDYISSFNSSPKNFFFGYGSRSVEKTISGGYYAHSDWFQLLHDYGLLGIIVLTSIHVSIVRLILKGIKAKFIYVPTLAMIYVIFFLLNIYSGMIFFPNSIYFGMFLSLYYKIWLKQKQQTCIY